MRFDLGHFVIVVSAMLCMVLGVHSALAAPQDSPAAVAVIDLSDEPEVDTDDSLESLLVEVATSMDHAFIDDDPATVRLALIEPVPTTWQTTKLARGRATSALDRPPRFLASAL